jgi:hypothetical protein
MENLPESMPAVPNSPAFWSHDQLAAHGVRNCTGFDARSFRWKVCAWRGQLPEERDRLAALATQALDERRRWFLMFAGACYRIPGWEARHWLSRHFWSQGFKRGRTHLAKTLRWHWTWLRLWQLERRAGPVRPHGKERPCRPREES